MRNISFILLLMFVVTTLSFMTGCHSTKPSSSVNAQTINIPACAGVTRDPVILTACMNFGPLPLTMDQRYNRIKSCILFADTIYADQLRMNSNVKLTQQQWIYLESYRTKELALCVRYGRKRFPSLTQVKHDKKNLLSVTR